MSGVFDDKLKAGDLMKLTFSMTGAIVEKWWKGIMTDNDLARQADHILRNFALYQDDPIYRGMIDNTVYVTPEQREGSALIVDEVYGSIAVQRADVG